MSRNTLRELICSHTKTYIVPSGGNFGKHKSELFTAQRRTLHCSELQK